MTSLIKKYPLDLTGESPDNQVRKESHTLVATNNGDKRVLIPQYGAFYTNSLIVRDEANDRELVPKVDYVATYLHEEATIKSGLEVCGAVVVIDSNVSNEIVIDYQVVGGEIGISLNAIEQIIEALGSEDNTVEWANIKGTPEYYPPGGHLHALWELYGFEYLIIQLERITQAIFAGNQASLDDLREYARELHEDAKDYTDDLRDDFNRHRDDTSNPHEVTKAQVGLGDVENFPMATSSEAASASRDDRYMSPRAVRTAIDSITTPVLNAHKADRGNPHSVTKAQVGLGSVGNHPMASSAEARAMSRSDRYMSPSLVGDSIGAHSESGDHDARYVRKNAAEDTGLRVSGGRLQAFVSGAWRTVWPAQWA